MLQFLIPGSSRFGRSWLRGARVQCVLVSALFCCAADMSQAQTADLDGRALATYVVLLEVNAANPTGRLSELASRRIAVASWSLDLNRTTAAFGRTGPLGPCSVTAARERPMSQDAVGIAAAVSHHAYVAPSYSFLPDTYQRDFVRSAFAGLTRAVNKVLSDPAISAQAKSFALGQYFHFAQDIFFNQREGKPGTPLQIIPGKPVGEPEPVLTATTDGALKDAALKAIAFTYDAAKTFNRTGTLPEVPAAEKFDATFYAPLSPAERAQLIKTLQDAGIHKYLEAIVAPYSKLGTSSGANAGPAGTAPKSTNTAASNGTTERRPRAALAQLWGAAHPKDGGFRPPDMSAPVYPDFVNYDVHPEWLVPAQLRQEEEAKARRPIDDLALAQQAGNLLRSKIEQFETSRKDPRSLIMLQALRTYSDDGQGALKQASSAKDPNEKRRSIALALSNFGQGLRDADKIELESKSQPSQPDSAGNRVLPKNSGTPLIQSGTDSSASPAAQQSSPTSPCIDEQSRAIEAFEQQLNEVVAIAVAVAFDRVGSKLSAEDQKTCRLAAFEDVRSVLKGGTPSVPEKCRDMASAGRVALARYARSHVRALNPGLEELLSNFR